MEFVLFKLGKGANIFADNNKDTINLYPINLNIKI